MKLAGCARALYAPGDVITSAPRPGNSDSWWRTGPCVDADVQTQQQQSAAPVVALSIPVCESLITSSDRVVVEKFVRVCSCVCVGGGEEGRVWRQSSGSQLE